jgi:hypothetical protein
MKTVLGCVVALIASFLLLSAAPEEKGLKPQYDEKGRLPTTANGCFSLLDMA